MILPSLMYQCLCVTGTLRVPACQQASQRNQMWGGLPRLNTMQQCMFIHLAKHQWQGQQHKGLVMVLDARNSRQSGCTILVVHAPCLFVVMNNMPANTYILCISQRRAGEVGYDPELGKAVQGSPRLGIKCNLTSRRQPHRSARKAGCSLQWFVFPVYVFSNYMCEMKVAICENKPHSR